MEVRKETENRTVAPEGECSTEEDTMVSLSGQIQAAVEAAKQLQATLEGLREDLGRGVGARELAIAITELEHVTFRIQQSADKVSEAGQ